MTDRAPVDIARSIISDPRRKFTVSALDIVRVCEALVAAEETVQSVITTELADAARALIAAEAAATLAKGPDGYAPLQVGLAREMAFLTFKSRFEEEFPNE